ncbi:hypothetical protein [Pollutimonas nitritireducens]|uniref:hypothetical protein n=1 Tax=Pollutimonas nitritireducens TaxID=2045209 RepID=UPI00130475BC|nr:hypothetical protein [Pollutimonas nitritireducens]
MKRFRLSVLAAVVSSATAVAVAQPEVPASRDPNRQDDNELVLLNAKQLLQAK